MNDKKFTNKNPVEKKSGFVGDSLFPHFTVKNPAPKVVTPKPQNIKITNSETENKN